MGNISWRIAAGRSSGIELDKLSVPRGILKQINREKLCGLPYLAVLIDGSKRRQALQNGLPHLIDA